MTLCRDQWIASAIGFGIGFFLTLAGMIGFDMGSSTSPPTPALAFEVFFGNLFSIVATAAIPGIVAAIVGVLLRRALRPVPPTRKSVKRTPTPPRRSTAGPKKKA